MIVENFEEIRVLGLDFTVSRVLIKCFSSVWLLGKMCQRNRRLQNICLSCILDRRKMKNVCQLGLVEVSFSCNLSNTSQRWIKTLVFFYFRRFSRFDKNKEPKICSMLVV